MSDERVLYIDLETFSETPIRDGSHRYAENVEILIAAWAYDHPAWGEGPITVEDLTDEEGFGVLPVSDELAWNIKEADRIVFHNGGSFDSVVVLHSLDQCPELPLEKCEDTLARAMAHGLPGGLEKLSEIFKLGADSKHAGGKDLIRTFCCPQPKGRKVRRHTKLTKPDEWATFLEYAGGDIQSMRALRAKLPNWNYPGDPRSNTAVGYRLWQLDQTINRRGFKVDLDLAESALAMIDRVKVIHDDYIEETTYGEVRTAGQRDALLKHLLDYYNVSLPDMQKGTLERRLEDPDIPGVVKELLSVRLDAAMASTSKYKALLRSVSADGRLRGTLQFCGAVRTGRWAGRLWQPHNLIRPTDEEAAQVDGWIEAIKSGIGEIVLRNPSRAAAVALRGSIVADEGRKIVAADMSNIEGRILAWLAGERWKLDAFAEYDAGIGPDLYKVTAGRILYKDPWSVTKDERQVMGKVPELALGFQGAAGAFGTMAALYGVNLTEAEVKGIVDGWREANPAITRFWYAMEEAARNATQNPGHTFTAGEHIAFHRTGEWLLMQLPSGHKLCYCQPALVPHPKWQGTSLSYLGVNSYTRRWERIHTYGGKLAENATQAASTGAWGVLGDAMLRVEAAGFPIILDVHDEIITEPPDDPAFTTERLCALLSELPWWADRNLPLAAAGFEGQRYRKD